MHCPKTALRTSPLIPALILLAVATAARWQTLGNPVTGFDEQFYLLVGDRMWRGQMPFIDIFDRKPVGLFLIYAAARSMGGSGFLAYKLLALLSVTGTAFVLYGIARLRSGVAAALIGASLYILWLNFMEGEGGQAPVFYDLPMSLGAAVLARAVTDRKHLARRGALAMLLVGAALQIKYSVLFEGLYFGCFLIAAAWGFHTRGARLVGSVLVWISCALMPTGICLAYYTARGHFGDFVFANFVSPMGQRGGDPSDQLLGAATIIGILSPLILFLVLGWRNQRRVPVTARATTFLIGWLGAATVGLMVYGRYASPHYAMPLLLPLTVLLAPVFDASRRQRLLALGLATVAFVGGQVAIAATTWQKGGAAAAMAVARAAHTERGCIYVYDGYPALYMLTHSCLPSRWTFPGHLSLREESSAAALGVDPVAELKRVLATRPVAIVDDFPRFSGGSPVAHAVLQRTLDTGYRLAACIRTGRGRVRLVYRRNTELIIRPRGCPSDAALRLGRPI